MKVLGLNILHGDSSACLIINGSLVAAVEEERFTKIKHCSEFPVNSIAYCLKKNSLEIDDVDTNMYGQRVQHKQGIKGKVWQGIPPDEFLFGDDI